MKRRILPKDILVKFGHLQRSLNFQESLNFKLGRFGPKSNELL